MRYAFEVGGILARSVEKSKNKFEIYKSKSVIKDENISERSEKNMSEYTQYIHVGIYPELYEKLENYKFNNRFKNRSEAVTKILENTLIDEAASKQPIMKNRIKELRNERNISQVTLATHIGCSQNYISRIELGLTLPTIDVALRLAEYFYTSIEYLFGLEPDEETVSESKAVIKKLSLLSDRDKQIVYSMINQMYCSR